MPLTGPTSHAVTLEKASSWEEVRRIADKFLPRWIKAILDGFDRARAGTSVRALIRLMEDGASIDQVVNEIDWVSIDGPRTESTRMVYPILLREVFESTAQAATAALERSPSIRVVGAFDIMNPRVADWIRAHSGDRITAITEESRRAIRDLILNAYEQGIPAAKLGRMIRSSIGLTSRQARAVAKYRARMEADGKNPAQIETLADKYAARLLRQRAEMIARTEIIAAENAGQIELWRQQIEAGNLPPTVLKEWIVTPDDRLCPECEELDGEETLVTMDFPGGVSSPPLHPNCRCAMGLVFPKALGVAA